MRFFMGMLALLAASAVWAGDVEYQRGEYRFSVGAEPGFISAHELPDRWDPKAPGVDSSPWRYWLYEEQIDRRAGRDHVYVDYAYEPRSASVLGDAGRFQITFNPAYQRLIIHRVELRRNGQWQSRLAPDRISLVRRETDFEQDLADGNVTALVVLDDVRVDDVIRIRYSTVGSNPILAGQIVDWSRFAWRSPVLDSRLRVLHEPGRKLSVHRENGAPEPTIRDTVDGVEVLFQVHGAAAVIDEESYPIWFQPFPLVQVSTQRSWADVVEWALPLYPPVDALPADVEARLAEWSALPDARARLTAALRTVQQQVRYFGVEMGDNTHKPTPPADTWNRRYGDCKDKAYLLVTLLDRLGIRAVPALVSTARGRAVSDFPPAASLFDHVVVRAELDGEVLWLDPTITAEGGDPRDSDLSFYGLALPIADGTRALQPIAAPTQGASSIAVSERYVPGADGSVKLSIETVYRGRSADYARRSIASQRSEDLSRGYAEYYRKRFGELSVVGAPVLQDDLGSNTLKVGEQYLLQSPFESIGAIKALDVYGEALSSVSTLPASMSRNGPLYFGMPARYRHEIRVDVPERWTPSITSEVLDYKSSGFAYKRDLRIDDGKVMLTYDMDVTAREITSDKVGEHLGELRKLRDSLSERLLFQMPAGLQRKERDQRLKALLRNAIDGEEKP